MHITRATERPYQDAGAPGIERGRIWGAALPGRGTASTAPAGVGHGVAIEFCRMMKNSLYARHPHASWEQMFVVTGSLAVDGVELAAGDFAFTEPGEWHEVRALEDSVVLLSFGQAPVVS
ncbi:MAG: cupin domain-containing protein [Steroidobacteraceae bacterium]